MIKNTIGLRYSKALFDQDDKKVHLEERLGYLEFLLKLKKAHPKVMNLLEAPHVDTEAKKKILRAILSQCSDITFLNLLYYLIEKRRFHYLPQIASEYRQLVNHYLGIWEAEIITAIPIDQPLKDELKSKLEHFYRKKIKFTNETNPKIIGGVIVVVGNEMIDWSIQSRLKRLKTALLATHV